MIDIVMIIKAGSPILLPDLRKEGKGLGEFRKRFQIRR